MSSFLILAALMLGVAGYCLATPLWRHASPEGAAPTPPQRGMAVGLLALVTLATAGLYVTVGDPQAWSSAPPEERRAHGPATSSPDPAADDAGTAPADRGAAQAGPSAAPPMVNGQAVGPAQIQAMVARLAQRLKTNPQDAEGWRMLARSYETLGRFPEAVGAYKQLIALSDPNADLLTDYAVALGMSQSQTLVGEPEAVLAQALKIDPQHVQALALSGSAAIERHDAARAIEQWTKILVLVPPGAEIRSAIEANIARAQAMADRPGRVRPGATSGP